MFPLRHRLLVMALPALAAVPACGHRPALQASPGPSTDVAATCPGGTPDADELAVMAAVIREELAQRERPVLVVDRANLFTSVTGSRERPRWAGDQASPAAIESYRSRNLDRSCLDHLPDPGLPVELLSHRDFAALMRDGGDGQSFRRAHGGSAYVVGFSRVGIDRAARQAVVMLWEYTMPEAMDDWQYRLRDGERGWTVDARFGPGQICLGRAE